MPPLIIKGSAKWNKLILSKYELSLYARIAPCFQLISEAYTMHLR